MSSYLCSIIWGISYDYLLWTSNIALQEIPSTCEFSPADPLGRTQLLLTLDNRSELREGRWPLKLGKTRKQISPWACRKELSTNGPAGHLLDASYRTVTKLICCSSKRELINFLLKKNAKKKKRKKERRTTNVYHRENNSSFTSKLLSMKYVLGKTHVTFGRLKICVTFNREEAGKHP